MLLKTFIFITCFSTIIDQCFSSKSINIFKNNYDLKVLKEYFKENNNTYPGGGGLTEHPTSYDEIVAIEKEFENQTATYSVKNFYLFTRDYRNGTKFEILDPRNSSSIKYCHFQSRHTYIIIHGFIGYGLESWILTLKDKLLNYEDSNVISVDWPAGERWFLPTYMTAAGRVPTIGNDTAFLLQSLIDFKGLLLQNVHCIGHSLGGHVCGFAGKPFKGRVGKISGLDPAGPYFHKVEASKRLDKKDAVYVDVMHTNACVKWPYWTGCYGLNENVGHSNFFPNGGEHQPGCGSYNDVTGNIGCDHKRAYMYYNYSMDFGTNQSTFLARPCDGWIPYETGNCSCGESAQYMGFNVNAGLEGTFYLETTSSPPYAMKDPDCSLSKKWSIVIVASCIIGGLTLFCSCSAASIVAILNIRRRSRAPTSRDEEEALVSSEEEPDTEEEEVEVKG